MQSLRGLVGYVSLKIRHIEKQAKMFPSLIGLPGEKSSQEEVDSAWAMKEDDINLESNMSNPNEEKDKTIMEQKRLIENLSDYQAKADMLEKELTLAKAENSKIHKKLNFTRKATEERICENISNETSYRDDPLLVAVLSATLNEDDVDLEKDDGDQKSQHLSRKDHFLFEALESKLDKNDETQMERLSHIKLQVLEKLKTTKLRRSVSNKRRQSDAGLEEVGRSLSRPRTISPSAQ